MLKDTNVLEDHAASKDSNTIGTKGVRCCIGLGSYM
jgi:hypothetical protein